MQRVMLYFGSFNPIHNGHIALAEHVLDRGLCDRVVLIVSPQSPHKRQFGLAPELSRFEMAEIACAASRYPERIAPSAIEFLLPRPSYTIDTLRYLEQNNGHEMRFSILMGGDQIARFDTWKEAEAVRRYPIWVYPRQGADTTALPEGMTLLDGAPLLDFSATELRERVQRGEPIDRCVARGVAEYIRTHKLWDPAAEIMTLTDAIGRGGPDAEVAALHLARGKCYYRMARWGDAINDFNRTLALDATSVEAQQLLAMVREILEFRYKDIYNP